MFKPQAAGRGDMLGGTASIELIRYPMPGSNQYCPIEERCDYTEDQIVSPLAPTPLRWSPLFTFSVALIAFWSPAQSK